MLARQPSDQNPYRQMSNRFKQLCIENGISLSEYSERLLDLSVEAWFNDPPPFKPELEIDNQRMNSLASRIFNRALQDRHIQTEMSRRGRVSFGPFMVSLAQAGQEVLRDLLEDKGFW